MRHFLMKYFSIFLLVFSFNLLARTKHALIVAIGAYPQVSGTSNWSQLSSLNDAQLVKKFLLDQGFKKEHIDTLYENQATSPNLIKSLDNAINKLEKGDVFYFHFSGHGQQVADLSADSKFIPTGKRSTFQNLRTDETDGYDEALVMFDAPLNWTPNYDLSAHFIDDQIKFYTQKIREKIGPEGQLILLLDACHSGTATRGSETTKVRGQSAKCEPEGYTSLLNSNDKTIGFDADIDFTNNGTLANMVAFFGCKAEQVNNELKDETGKGYGSLTYFFIQSVYELKDQASYQNLFSKINEKMIIKFRNQQNPIIEGDNLNTLVFDGGVIPQKAYFNLTRLYSNTASLDAGILRGLQKGDSLGFYSNITTDPKNSNLLFKGCITDCDLYSSKVLINMNHLGSKEDYVKYRAFLINTTNNAGLIKLKINVSSKLKRKELTKYFEGKSNVKIVEKDFDYQIVDTLINNETQARIYIGNNTVNPLRGMSFMSLSSNAVFDEFYVYLNQSLRADAFRKIDLKNPKASATINIFKRSSLPGAEYDTSQSISGNFQVKDDNFFGLYIRNDGSDILYANIIDIFPDNRIVWMDAEKSPGKLHNFQVKPNAQLNTNNIIKCSVSKPFGMEQFKIIVSEEPLDFSQLEEIGSSLSRGQSGDNPLLDYINSSLSGTRGSTGSVNIGASVINVFFEIIP